MSKPETTETQALTCPHGIRHPVVCPQCEPEVYRRARPQVERWLREQTAAGRRVQSL